uniref:2-oxoacid:acceptor oxidoreductase subunit alpha n=1 Tax=Caldicellulosiruptor owensensis TaxID=55205 RepID=A0A7C5V202_9FIRM
MSFNVFIGGEASQGIEFSAKLLSKALVKLGFYAFSYRDFGSYIKGGKNFNVVSFSEKPIYSHELSFDFAILLTREIFDAYKNLFKENCIYISEFEPFCERCVKVDVKNILSEIGAKPIARNSALLGAFFKALDLPIEILLEVIKEEAKDEKNLEVARLGYERSKTIEKIDVPKKKVKRILIDGTAAVGLGAIYYGIDLYFAYPMTPSTPLLHFLSSMRDEYNFKTMQLENEIAVVNAALGASYAGAICMVGTSGGGFDLMGEAISLQGMTEVPLVVYLAQRAGPSTGMPTHTMQSDLKLALNCGHGDFPRVVIAPGDAKDAFYKTIEAFYLAYKYGVTSIILSDKHLAESYFTFDKFEKPKIKPERFIFEKVNNFKSYEITRDFVPKRSIPEKVIVKANSYEHDEFGFTTDDNIVAKIMQEKRLKKFEALKREVKKKFEMAKVFGEGRNLIISFGSTKGAILDALQTLKEFRFLQILYISPFPTEIVRKEIESSKKAVIIENNVSGQLGKVIMENVGIRLDEILKYDGRPFTREEIVFNVKKFLCEKR